MCIAGRRSRIHGAVRARASISFTFLAYHEKWRSITRSEYGREEGRKETFTGEEEDGQTPPLAALIAFDTVVAAIVADDATCACGNWSG